MTRKLPFFLISVFFVFLSSVVLAASSSHGEEHHHIDWLKGFVYPAINFIILFGALFFFARKPVIAAFKKRSENTKATLSEAKALYDKAYREFQEIEGKLKNADVEGKNLLKSLQEEAELEKQKMIQEANQLSEKIKNDAQRIAGQEVQKATQMLKEQTVKLAMGLATEKAKNEVTFEDQVQLGKEFASKIG